MKDRMIYHYTTLDAFMGMSHTPTETEKETADVNNDVDWAYYLNIHASDIRMMNDKRENAILDDILRKASPIMRCDLSYTLISMKEIYAVSFCKQRDYVPMWRGYANGQIGICLGFITDLFLERVGKINNESISFENCMYLSESGIKRKINKEIKDFSKDTNIQGNGHDIQTDKTLKIIKQSPFYKLKDFEYEKEVRLAAFATSCYDVKPSRLGFTRYMTIKVPLTLLKEIIVSPLADNRDLVRYGIEGFLCEQGLNNLSKYGIDIKVNESKLEIR